MVLLMFLVVPATRAELPEHAPEGTEAAANWLQEMTVRVQEYRRLYNLTLQAYVSLQENYLDLKAQYHDLERRLTLEQAKREDAELFLQSEKDAWARLFQKTNEAPTATSQVETERPPEFLGISFYEPSPDVHLEGNLWERIRYRYRFYRHRYETLRESYVRLQTARDALRKETVRLTQEIEQWQDLSQDPYQFWRDEKMAWERLYRE